MIPGLFLYNRIVFSKMLCRYQIGNEIVRKLFPAQQRRRMISREHEERSELFHLTALTRDLNIPVINISCRNAAEAYYDLGANERDLCAKIGEAGVRFVGEGVSILRRTAFYNVADIDAFAVKAGFLKQIVEKPSRGADKRYPLFVLFASGAFADEHYVGMRIAVGDDDIRACFTKPAFGADLKIGIERIPIES